jgi:sulfate adenylyltransferase
MQAKARGLAIFLTGLSGAGKTMLAQELGERLEVHGHRVTLLDGDDLRARFSPDLGFSRSDREENVRRAAVIASEVVKHGGIAVCPFIAPYEKSRQEVRRAIEQHGSFFLVFVSTPLAECERRDPKGLYRKARSGEIASFTGISDVYEPPLECDFRLDTTGLTQQEAADRLIRTLAVSELLGSTLLAAVCGLGKSRAIDERRDIDPGPVPAEEDRRVRLFRRMLKVMEARRCGLKDVAREVGVERHTVERTVQFVTGQSFRELQQKLILERATILLGRGRSIKEAAFDLGFGSPQAFHRFVRRASGQTPASLHRARGF